jgi:hypothetical protein
MKLKSGFGLAFYIYKMKNNNIRLAQATDIQSIVKLINTAYRSNLGWTHEHDIV